MTGSKLGHPSPTLTIATLAVAILLTACAAPPGPAAERGEAAKPAAPKRITAAILGDPPMFVSRLNPSGVGIPGAGELDSLVSGGLSRRDDLGALRPTLAEAVPTVENGQWVVFPDGRMETTWKIKPAAQWSDGTPFTAADVLFTATVDQDAELPIRRDVGFTLVDTIEAPAPDTVRVRWKRPYIDADTLFNGPPLPAHLLERPYREDKANFLALPYWTDQFVGTGPFRLREWVRSSHVVLEANDRYILGRPRIDEIEMRFIPDTNTLVANVLSGALDLTLGRGVSLEQALTIRERWKEGSPEIVQTSRIVMYPQFMDANPAIITDVRFRRALMHAMDRQEMADTLNAGLSAVAHVFLAPREPEYADIERSIVRYDYDPRKAMQIVEELGYAKGPDGMYRDIAGQRLAIEVRTSPEQEIHIKAMEAAANYWRKAGIGPETTVIPSQRARDRPYVQTFPGLLLYRQGSGFAFLKRLRISETPLPENNFVGNNNSRYVSQEFDSLLDRIFTTIPRAERMQIAGQAVHWLTDQVLLLDLFYDTQSVMIADRLINVRKPGSSNVLWNSHEWDTTS